MIAQKSTPAVARRSRRPVAKPTLKVKTAVHLSPEAFKRLDVHCAMEGRTQSDLVEELILSGLKRYRVQTIDRAGAGDSPTDGGSASVAA